MLAGVFYTLSVLGLVVGGFYLFVGGAGSAISDRLPIALAIAISALFMLGLGKLLDELESIRRDARRSAEALDRIAQAQAGVASSLPPDAAKRLKQGGISPLQKS